MQNGYITGHWDGHRRAYAIEGKEMRVVSRNASGEDEEPEAPEKLWHHLTCLDVAIQTAHSFFSPSKARAKPQKKPQWSETGGADRTHLSLRHFKRELFFTECEKWGIKPESPGEEFKLPRNTGSISEHLR